MKADLVDLDIVGHDNWSFWPEDIEYFCVSLEALVRPTGSEGYEIFKFDVCSPKWFAEKEIPLEPKFVRHWVLINEYDEGKIKGLVKDLIESTSGETWHEVAEKLSRYMFWEFEDYQPSNSSTEDT